MGELKVLTRQQDTANIVIRYLEEQVAAIKASGYEKDMGGFALVVWDQRGTANACWKTVEGPISQDLVPLFVQQVLARETAVADAKAIIFEPSRSS